MPIAVEPSLRERGAVSSQDPEADAIVGNADAVRPPENRTARCISPKGVSAVTKETLRGDQKSLVFALVDSRPLLQGALAHGLRMLRRDCQLLFFSTADDLLGSPSVYDDVDMVLLSAHSADIMDGELLDVVGRLCAASPSKPIIVISDRDDADAIAAIIAHGARGYIPTSFNLAVAMAALEVVLAGGTFAPAASLIQQARPVDTRDLSRHPTPALNNAEHTALSTRKAQVLACLAEGKSNKMIARQLNIREGTVKVHLRHLMRKLGATNRTQLALRALIERGSG